jgi:SAM-dependent methyltransferase
MNIWGKSRSLNMTDEMKTFQHTNHQITKSRLQYISSCLDHYCATPLIETISPSETMFDQWYMHVGCSAVDVIVQSIYNSWVGRINRILDIPCGHGRVLRHIVNLFPEAKVYASDIDKDGVQFCQNTLGAIGINSNEDLTSVDFGTQFDLIWVGSLFTHTSREITRSWLAHLARFLSENGIIIATIHGRWSETVAQQAPYINQESWEQILRDYRASGYGYHDYAKSENHDYNAGSYGVSLTRASELLKIVETIKDVRIFSYRERAWADHQDVVVLGKPSFNQKW